MSYLRNRDGFIKPLLIIAILVAGVYAGTEFGVPHYHYESFKSDAKEIARVASGPAERIRSQVFESAQEHKIPIEEKDILVIRKDKSVQIQAEWSVTVDLMGLYQKTFDFRVDVEE